jgi:CRP/FNR family transcriptional regulator
MFCNFDAEALADLNTIGHLGTFPTGAALQHEDDLGERILILCSGQVKLSCMSRGGRILNLKIALPGEVLGLSAVISNSPQELSAVALTPITANIIRKAPFISFLGRHPEASMHAAQSLAQEYKSAFLGARRLALSGSVAGMVASLFLGWGHSASCGKANLHFNMFLTHGDLAAFTGSSRETITRTLGKFQKEGLVRINGVFVQILAPEKLAELAA